jgi:transposase
LETDPTRMCALLVGLPDVKVLAVDTVEDQPLTVHIEQIGDRPGCPDCGGPSMVKDRSKVVLADLPAFGRPARLVWHKYRLECPDPGCAKGSWTWEDPRIAWPRHAMTDRAGRWVTVQVGQKGRSVAEVARELDVDWHTVSDAVVSYGTALIERPERTEVTTTALGLDETLFIRRGRWHRQEFVTSIVDVSPGRTAQLLDVVAGRSATGATEWINACGEQWRQQVRWGCSIFPALIAKPSTTPCPTPPRWPTRSTCASTPNSWMSAAGGCRTRPWGIGGRRDDPLYRGRRL